MGLDMYLTGKIYVGAEYEFSKVRFLFGDKNIALSDIKLIAGDEGTEIPIDFTRLNTVTMRVGYWRKANAIHKWFVDNVQDGEDECQEAWVSRDQLEALLDVCEKVLLSPEFAHSLLPTESGFFFGDTSYNEYYFEDIRQTIKIVRECLSYEPNVSFYYQSSW